MSRCVNKTQDLRGKQLSEMFYGLWTSFADRSLLVCSLVYFIVLSTNIILGSSALRGITWWWCFCTTRFVFVQFGCRWVFLQVVSRTWTEMTYTPQVRLPYRATASWSSVIITTSIPPARWSWYHTAAEYTHLQTHTHTHTHTQVTHMCRQLAC